MKTLRMIAGSLIPFLFVLLFASISPAQDFVKGELIYDTHYVDYALNKQGIAENQARAIPEQFVLHQNYPNPFNPGTEIRYELPHAGHVSLVIFNIAGQTIHTLVDESKLAGYHSILWDGRDAAGNEVASGIYIYRFLARSNEAAFETVKKMTLLR
jgi:hypothetical protein